MPPSIVADLFRTGISTWRRLRAKDNRMKRPRCNNACDGKCKLNPFNYYVQIYPLWFHESFTPWFWAHSVHISSPLAAEYANMRWELSWKICTTLDRHPINWMNWFSCFSAIKLWSFSGWSWRCRKSKTVDVHDPFRRFESNLHKAFIDESFKSLKKLKQQILPMLDRSKRLTKVAT